MFAVLGAWAVVLGGVLDRLAYATGRALRRPRHRILRLLEGRRLFDARGELARERERAAHGLERIEGVSQLATSIGLFGTVLGIAVAFVTREPGSGGVATGIAAGLSTALFTTVGGLAVYLVGESFLVAYREWVRFCDRGLDELLELDGEA